jgi:hypothetical protein
VATDRKIWRFRCRCLTKRRASTIATTVTTAIMAMYVKSEVGIPGDFAAGVDVGDPAGVWVGIVVAGVARGCVWTKTR